MVTNYFLKYKEKNTMFVMIMIITR